MADTDHPATPSEPIATLQWARDLREWEANEDELPANERFSRPRVVTPISQERAS